MELSLFTKIINGEIPSHKIYEDDKVYAFLDIYPITPGHTLVIPKRQVEFLWDLDDEDYQAVMMASKKIANNHKAVLGVAYIGEQVMGTDVPHAHVHIIPFNTPEEFRHLPDMSGEPDTTSLAEIAEKLRIV